MRELLRHTNVRQVEAYQENPDGEVSYQEAERFIKDPDSFAKRIEAVESEPFPGLILSERSVELGDGHFSNMYTLKFPNRDESFNNRLVTLPTPLYQHRMFKEVSANRQTDEDVIATINGAFFYLQDDPTAPEPDEIMYNLNMRNGAVIGLPSTDRCALVTNKDGDLRAVSLKAEGILECGDSILNWKGGEPLAHNRAEYKLEQNEVYIFNPACCTIQYDDPKDKRTLRKVQLDKNSTPKQPDALDIVVAVSETKGTLEIIAINEGGGTDFFKGNFIMHGRKDDLQHFQIGDEVLPTHIDSLDLKEVESAMTVGPMVHHFLSNDDHEINHDPSLGTFPPFAPNERYARSAVYADNHNAVHFVVFDAVPRSEHMKGVTPKEAAMNIPGDAQWAVFLDGGQSSRITFKADTQNGLDSRGNQQYVRLHKLAKSNQNGLAAGKEDQYLWSRRGREVPSMVTLSKKRTP